MEIQPAQEHILYTPPDAFYAARKVALVERAFAGAGYPVPIRLCRRLVAEAWGWSNWAEVEDALRRGDEASLFDEEIGHDLMRMEDPVRAMALARRRGDVASAFAAVTGLPMPLADSFADGVRLTDGPGSRSGIGTRREMPWLTPEQFQNLLRLSLEPVPPRFADLARSLSYASGAIPSAYPPPPPHRPRR